jgi:Na+-transporting NADH:ubiquinone oxidoreductase subunit NqrB
MILGLLPLSFFFPIYRAECLLGFVLVMTYTFGAILPTGIGSFLILIGMWIYLFLRSGMGHIGSKLIQSGSSVKNQSGGMRT